MSFEYFHIHDPSLHDVRAQGNTMFAIFTPTYLNVSLTVRHELTIQNHQRDALNIINSSNIITLLYMFRVSSTHLQEDIVVHKQHMVPSLSIRVLVSC